MSLWIDLTDLLEWRGNLTGIQRIQFNISKLYLESGKDVKFFTYHSASRKFLQVNFDVNEVVRSGIVREKPSTWSVYRAVLRRAGLLNTEIRLRKRIVRHVYAVSSRTHRSVRSPFLSHDTVLVMGSIWTGSFIDDLYEAKSLHKFKLVHFAFDMIPSKFPGFVVPWLHKVFTTYYTKAFSIADAIIAISESTARDVGEFMELHKINNKAKIGIVRAGENIDDTKSTPVARLAPGFILSVSTIEARKNHLALFYAAKDAHSKGIKIPHIVIAGRKGWHTSDLLYMIENDPVASKAITIIYGANDAKLTWLYQHCAFTVFPSFYEGWGMPVAESLAFGKVCIASDTSSIPEIAGDLVDYFSPYDTGALLDKIVEYTDKKILANKESQIKQKYRPSSWEDMYKQLNKVVDTL